MEFLELLAKIRTPFLDAFFQFCTYLGQDIPVLVVICILFWCVNKKLGYQIGLTFFASGLLLQNLKITFRVERPWVLNPEFQAVESAIPAATGYSFPSGHTQTATALYSSLALYTKKKSLKILLFLLFPLVGFSRMYLGCHTPKDVLTAIGITLAVSIPVYLFSKKLKNTDKENALLCLILSVLSMLTFCYAAVLALRGTISTENAMDCCKAGGAGLAFGISWYLEHRFINFSTDGSFKGKTLRFLFGIAVTALLHAGLKVLMPATLVSAAVQYFLLVLWIVCLYPLIIKWKQT
ncbi:MAG: phosphatase PAP2 family protein [Lachnospiraceae bacterium]|jgi:membrane-associated phospholipid phosphatase|nr:phosphatase PAP2 family protein [Lachnospiraceae bacterium]